MLTQQLTITSQLANVFRGADVDAIMNFSLRGASLSFYVPLIVDYSMPAVLHQQYHPIREGHCAQNNYQLPPRLPKVSCLQGTESVRSCAQSSSLAQLILPESLKLLPLYSLGLLKTTLLRKGSDVGIDDRAFLIAAFNSMPIITVIR